MLFLASIQGQGDCIESYGTIYGLPDGNERGTCLVASPGNDAMYVAGMKEDSVLLLKVDLLGEILWSRTFDVIPGQEEFVTCITLDSDGMLAIAGIAGDISIGGTVFILRYDPDNHQVLWASEYITSPNNLANSLIQKGPGGNYLMSNNPHYYSVPTDDNELLEIDKNTGAVLPSISKHYFLITGSEGLQEIIYDGNFIYGVGRYTDGGGPATMRHTMVKMNPTNGSNIWTKMGHVPPNQPARLYGFNLLLDQGELVTGYFGDPSGTSTTNTKLYLQKTSLDGDLIWLKQYELPGNNDGCYALIKSGGGYVVLAGKGAPSGKLMLFKVNTDGSMAWGKTYQFSDVITSASAFRGQSKLIEVGGKLVFTAIGVNPGGTTDMLLVMTDLNGMVDNPCVTDQTLSIPVTTISNPTFYSVSPTESIVVPIENSEFPEPVISPLPPREECTITDTVYSFISAMICAGDVYEGYSLEGTYVDEFTTNEGCDSFRTLDLEVNDPLLTNEQISICLGETYAGYSEEGIYPDTFQNVSGCDSIHILNLNVIPLTSNLIIHICQGEQFEEYTSSGSYIDTLQGPAGSCDTIRFLELIVHPPDLTSFDVTICDGEVFEEYSIAGVYVDYFFGSDGCDSIRTMYLNVIEEEDTEEEIIICLGESYEGYSAEGIYLDTFQNFQGCDSIHMLTLIVEALEIDLSIGICAGEQYDGYTLPGTYIDTIQSIGNSCDTIRYLELTVNNISSSTIEAFICSGNNYEGYTMTGQYIDQFLNVAGCDSVRTLHLTVADEILVEMDVEICQGDSFEGYTQAGTYVDEFTTSFGCDSIRTLNIIIQPPLQTSVSPVICSGQSYSGYTETGIYLDTLQSSVGCDSILIINLLVTDEIHTNENITICTGEIYEGYSESGIYLDTFSSVYGCDSIRALNLAIGIPEKVIDVAICDGSQFENYTETGLYIDTIQGALGACDTVRHLNLVIIPVKETMITHSICEGQNFLGYNSTGIYTDTFQTVDGCDSIRVLDLTVGAELVTDEFVQICLGDSYKGYSTSGLYLDTLAAVIGCDSIIRLHLNVVHIEKKIDVEICSGKYFENYSSPGIYIDTLKGITEECDTIRHLSLTVLPATQTTLEKEICAGDNYYGYTSTGAYTDTLIAIDGCDSVRTVMLAVSNGVLTQVEASICDGLAFGYSKPGIFIDTLTSYFGCDSIRKLVLKGGSLFVPNVFSPNNDSRNDFFELLPSAEFIPELYYFAIFDRLGNMAYETVNFPVKWDGRDTKGQTYNPAVFTYVLIYQCGDKRLRQTGDITLMR